MVESEMTPQIVFVQDLIVQPHTHSVKILPGVILLGDNLCRNRAFHSCSGKLITGVTGDGGYWLFQSGTGTFTGKQFFPKV